PDPVPLRCGRPSPRPRPIRPRLPPPPSPVRPRSQSQRPTFRPHRHARHSSRTLRRRVGPGAAPLPGRCRGRHPSRPPLRCAIPSFCLLIGRVSMPGGLFYRDTVHAGGGTAMEMRVFGRTRMQLSALGFGCGSVGGLMVRGDPADQERTIARATAAGVNYFDTAVQYGNGEAEKNLGRVLQKLKPTNAVVGTKVRLASGDFARIADAVAKSLESSLTRLRLDHVDIFHLHNAITETGGGEALSVRQVLGDVVPAFERLRQ